MLHPSHGRDKSGPYNSRNKLPNGRAEDRKSTRLNSSHLVISYAVFCLKKKKHRVLLSWRRASPARSLFVSAPLGPLSRTSVAAHRGTSTRATATNYQSTSNANLHRALS